MFSQQQYQGDWKFWQHHTSCWLEVAHQRGCKHHKSPIYYQKVNTLTHKIVYNYWELVTSNFELKFLLNFLDIWKKVIKKETSDLDKRKKYKKTHKLAGKSVSRKKRWKGRVLVVLAQILFYNWCLFNTNPSSEISIDNYCENKCQN